MNDIPQPLTGIKEVECRSHIVLSVVKAGAELVMFAGYLFIWAMIGKER